MTSRVNHYAGLISNRNRRSKYEGCKYVRICGGTARLLTHSEIAEFKAGIDKIVSKREAR
jgi:hypothetical protein